MPKKVTDLVYKNVYLELSEITDKISSLSIELLELKYIDECIEVD